MHVYIYILGLSGTPSGDLTNFMEAVVESDSLIFRTYSNHTEDLIDENVPRQISTTYGMALTVQLKCDPDSPATSLVLFF